MTYKADVVREVNGTILKDKAQIIQFSDGNYETDDKDKIVFIKRHSDFGVNIFVSEESEIQHHAIAEENEILESPKKKGRSKKVL